MHKAFPAQTYSGKTYAVAFLFCNEIIRLSLEEGEPYYLIARKEK
jgi:hypothetical protein